MSGQTIAVTDANFDELVLKSTQPVLLDFWAPWCGPCVSIAPTLEAIAAEYKGKAVVAKMNVDENKHVPTTFGVRSIPYLVVFHKGEVVDAVAGAVPKTRLTGMLDKALN